jgi:hypothetical protein
MAPHKCSAKKQPFPRFRRAVLAGRRALHVRGAPQLADIVVSPLAPEWFGPLVQSVFGQIWFFVCDYDFAGRCVLNDHLEDNDRKRDSYPRGEPKDKATLKSLT